MSGSYKEEEGAPSTSSRASSQGDEEEGERFYYIEQITGMKDFELTTLYVDFAHLSAAENVLARAIAEQYYRCVWACLTKAIPSSIKSSPTDFIFVIASYPTSA